MEIRKYKKEICNGCNLDVYVETTDCKNDTKNDETIIRFDFCEEENTEVIIEPCESPRNLINYRPLFDNSVNGITIKAHGYFERLNLIQAMEFAISVLKKQD